MADLGAIISFVSWGSKLALELYKFAATVPWASEDITDIACTVGDFSLTTKHVATLLRENDHYASAEARETIEDVLEQCKAVYTEIESILPIRHVRDETDVEHSYPSSYESWNPNAATRARLEYLTIHLESLKSTISVMLQALNTVQIILWARTRPTISPQRSAKAVSNEKDQLETLVIEQQMSLLSASKLYDAITQAHETPDPKLLMEEDSSQSLTTRGEQDILGSSQLFRFQDSSLVGSDLSDREMEWLPKVCQMSRARMDLVLQRWTRLEELEARIADEERHIDTERRQGQQPTVESDASDNEDDTGLGIQHNAPHLVAPDPQRHPNLMKPLFPDSPSLSIPVPDSTYGPTAPLSPASSFGTSPRVSGQSLLNASHNEFSPQSPRSSIGTLPMEAAAAVHAKAEEDGDDIDLGIPWRLCTRKYYWDYIDGKVQKTNTHLPSSQAFEDRKGWTEIMASWLDKAAIKEAGLSYTRFQKERQEGRKTRFESCYRIQQPLTFAQVQRLVERTVELFEQKRLPTPPSDSKRERNRRSSQSSSYDRDRDRDQTPTANTVRRLERSTTTYPISQPPHLDRTTSLPVGITTHPPHPTQPLNSPNAYFPAQQPPYSPQIQNPYAQHPFSPHALPPPPPLPATNLPFNPIPHPSAHPSSHARPIYPQPPLRTSQPIPNINNTAREPNNNKVHYSSASGTSDSDIPDAGATRSRANQSKSRRRPFDSRSNRDGSRRRKGNSTVGTLAKVGGLATLLDGIIDLGVL
jgi:hypothetical protein